MPVIPVSKPVVNSITAKAIQFRKAAAESAQKVEKILDFGLPKENHIFNLSFLESGKIKSVNIFNELKHITQIEYYNNKGGLYMAEYSGKGIPSKKFSKFDVMNCLKEQEISPEKFDIYYNSKKITQEEIDKILYSGPAPTGDGRSIIRFTPEDAMITD